MKHRRRPPPIDDDDNDDGTGAASTPPDSDDAPIVSPSSRKLPRGRQARSYSDVFQAETLEVLDLELFDWDGPLPQVPHLGPPTSLIQAWWGVVELERFVLFGLLLCLDVLLDVLALLPIKAIFALYTVLRNPTRVYPKQLHVLTQCATLVICCTLLAYLDLDLADTFVAFRNATTWTKVHTLFLTFSALDLLMTHLGARVQGNLTWAIQTGQQRVLMFVISVCSILFHSVCLLWQVSALHTGVAGGTSLLGLMLAIKLTAGDLKAGVQTKSLDSDTLLSKTNDDIVDRFKWDSFIAIIILNHVSRVGTDVFTDWEFFMSMCVCYMAAVALDWTKHAFYVLKHDWLTASTYSTFRTRFSLCFLSAPKLGFSDTSISRTKLSTTFHFIAMPISVILLLEASGPVLQQCSATPLGRIGGVLFVPVALFAVKILVRQFLRWYAHHHNNAGQAPRHRRRGSMGMLSILKAGLVGLASAECELDEDAFGFSSEDEHADE